ncbi:hypothetical protein GLOTRDRAFT_46421 [Gloeophyllum trabeum ATCC 11539]|uniref:N-acetyltransferase domain-containing protein n=1 Tax=Gloeophyllum trabeum (strain ATCC 11539 / FP-39264 / Madison 617) TaxID=670483 RepID=S7RJ58_GLOTA|nr:uncharacterized protein GLOTRDRAFT_46421 [Gloeophyllum trabeum ATCC 11539]EPQ52659.1 hypothetical protein GLOTRDRAFT_46421 [Gloeophyllum trabeum ATCC 11539]
MVIYYRTVLASEISADELKECADLFSSHYGVWGEGATTVSPFLKPQARVKMTTHKLASECFGESSRTVISTCKIDDALVGHAIAVVWDYDGGRTGWIAQLVVHESFRRRWIATSLLQALKEHPLFKTINVIGLVSSHPASCNALVKYANIRIEDIDLDFIRANAERVLRSTPIGYLKASLVGGLFGTSGDMDAVSCLFTKYFVDHREPREVLQSYKNAGRWPLGDLPPGHEFLVLVPVVSSL